MAQNAQERVRVLTAQLNRYRDEYYKRFGFLMRSSKSLW